MKEADASRRLVSLGTRPAVTILIGPHLSPGSAPSFTAGVRERMSIDPIIDSMSLFDNVFATPVPLETCLPDEGLLDDAFVASVAQEPRRRNLLEQRSMVQDELEAEVASQ